MHTVNVSLATLRAVRTHAAVQDDRYYLNGVLVDCPNSRIVGADGHRMMVACIEEGSAAPAFIIGSVALDQISKAYDAGGYKVGGNEMLVSFDVPADLKQPIVATVPSGTVSFTAIDSKYPEWWHVMPGSLSGETAQYNPEYVLAADKALRIIRNEKKGKGATKHFQLAHNGDSPAVMHSTDLDGRPVVVIIMPLRFDASADSAMAAVIMITTMPTPALAIAA